MNLVGVSKATHTTHDTEDVVVDRVDSYLAVAVPSTVAFERTS